MCGIALIISGVTVDSSSLVSESGSNRLPLSYPVHELKQVHEQIFTVDSLKECLLRRGPDHLGSKKIFLQSTENSCVRGEENFHTPISHVSEKLSLETPHDSFFADFESKREADDGIQCSCVSKSMTSLSLSNYVQIFNTDVAAATANKSVAEFHFLGATLQLRGANPVHQPLVNTHGDVLVYNGEIFGGINVKKDTSDSESLMHELERCCSCNCHALKLPCCCYGEGHVSVPELLSTVRGPWALIYWQVKSKTIWYGRDAFGRRSLLVHWPTLDDPRFLLSSVSPISSTKTNFVSAASCNASELGEDSGMNNMKEVSCGIHSISMDASKTSRCESLRLVGEVRKHEWADVQLKKLIQWDRAFVEPKSNELCSHCLPFSREDELDLNDFGRVPADVVVPENHAQKRLNCLVDIPCSVMNGAIQKSALPYALKVLLALKKSVMRRTTIDTIPQAPIKVTMEGEPAPVAILFSGGLDSMILAALLDQCLDARYGIDLLNVSFDGQVAPDRISARAGVKELQKITCRRWRLVEIDSDLSGLTSETKYVMSLISPSKTYMDLNIGIALWLAASGNGWIYDEISNVFQNGHQRQKYKSEAKVLLVGSGADEQCAGYSRHKTKYRTGGWLALDKEMKLDMHRIWKRNLGRDDRCISDNGKEARYPFLDEDVIETLLEIPLWEIVDLDLPAGKGDKKILREVARLLGLEVVADLPKRAIQFGSRIARESNRKIFGSNRAANQASAGSAVICDP